MTTATNADATFRVLKFDTRLLTTVKEHRGETRWIDFLTTSVEEYIDSIQESLLGLGIRAWEQDQTARLPVDPAIIDRLREASQETGVPMQTLLMACLFQTAGISEARKSQRKAPQSRRPKSRQGTSKAKGSQRKATRGAKKRGAK